MRARADLSSGVGYSLAGSLAWHLERTYGRAMSIRLLRASNEAEILEELSITEAARIAAGASAMASGGRGRSMQFRRNRTP